MNRGVKPAKAKVEARRPAGRKPVATDDTRVLALESRLADALEQQAATSEILRVISASPSDVKPVLDAVAERAARLCKAPFARVLIVDGDVLNAVADFSVGGETPIPVVPVALKRTSISGRAVLDGDIVHLADILPLLDTEFPDARDNAHLTGFRAALAVPLVREAGAYGAIFLWRREPGLFAPDQVALMQTFARQAAIAIENVRLFKEVNARNGDLTEALEQQGATSEILHAISRSPTDVKPVFETIAANALRLCDATFSVCYRFDGELIHIAALHHVKPEGIAAFHAAYPCPPSRGGVTQRAILTGGLVHVADVRHDPEYVYHDAAKNAVYRSVLSVPMLRDGRPIGAITVFREVPGPFPDTQVALLQTFADQAVIAVENVHLFTELDARNHDLADALEQQEATSEILRAIAGSPTDIQPVLETVVRAAARFCGAPDVALLRVDGGVLRGAAAAGAFGEMLIRRSGGIEALEMPLTRESVSGRAAVERRSVHVHDLAAESEDEYPMGRELQRRLGHRTMLAVPLLREGATVGVIDLFRTEVKPFSEKQVELLRTFADQAVIAIENVRLFTELGTRNRDLTVALEQQTATSEILRAISSSPTDVKPVFDIIGESAEKLCDAEISVVSRIDGELIQLVALHGATTDGSEAIRRRFPMRLDAETVTARSIRRRAVVHIADALTDPGYEAKDAASTGGYRACLGVPMFREAEVSGSIFVARREPGLFTESQVQLLRTFADQAVIAIENVRLFTELGARNRDLTEALEQQTATSEILRAISSSPTDVQPVFDIIAQRAGKLCDAEVAVVSRFDSKLIELAAIDGLVPEGVKIVRTLFPMPVDAQTVTARVVRDAAVVHLPDVFAEQDYEIKDFARAAQYRSALGVPILRNHQVIGVIFVGRVTPGMFADTQVQLLKTFADQAVIAIENVRLFTALEARNHDLTVTLEQQTATSEILRVISQSQTDVQPVFDTIAAAAHRLCRADSANVFTFDGTLIHLVAFVNANPDYADALRRFFPRPPGRQVAVTRAILSRSIVAIPDVDEDAEYAIPMNSATGGFRSVLAIPLLREESAVGAIAVGRADPGPFPDNQIALLQTFADQALIAIENVRLFTELEARTTQLTRSVEELKALGEVGQAVSSTLDLATVLSTIVSRATQLTGMDGGAIYEYDEAREQFHLQTTDRLPADLVAALRAAPMRKGEGAIGKLAITGLPVEIRDIADEGAYQSRIRKILVRLGYRSLLAVPLLREDHLLGGLVVNRKSAGAFAPDVIDLLKTFATQSALAIQNARLFREIGDKSRQLEIASQHKSEFLANMSHELRTPLNAIIGFSEVLAERMFGEINDKQAEYLADILESGRHLLSLINDILDLSKIEAGRMELDLADFDLPGAMDNTMTLVRERAHRRGIVLERNVDARVGKIRGDERKVKQVLLNLLSNALKFTPEGGRIDVRADVRDDRYEISVTDTGVGIAPEDLDAVFEEFRQVGSAASCEIPQ